MVMKTFEDGLTCEIVECNKAYTPSFSFNVASSYRKVERYASHEQMSEVFFLIMKKIIVTKPVRSHFIRENEINKKNLCTRIKQRKKNCLKIPVEI